MRQPLRSIQLMGLFIVGWAAGIAAAEPTRVVFESIPKARIRFGGMLGRRIDANVDQWLIPAPAANPGMLGMFQVRDRKPVPRIVPWAGEFAGKYLMSAAEALRLSDDTRLRPVLDAFVTRLLASQDADGYLGPFPKNERLLGHWDLWGHNHVMLGLLLWYEQTGDARALDACRRIAALIKATYPDRRKSFLDAGAHEMNMAIMHALGRLDQVSPDPAIRETMNAVARDWQRAGDYHRTGIAGVDFFRSPSPRWESLADLQGLVVLYELTGEQSYRDAFLNHWRSIRRTDRHNTGGFSTGEQACGDPYEPGAIETCCTIAWMAITLDALRLTGSAACVDELELATENAALGAQHPSGRWWTYSTPMDGHREASAHAIVFQARAGTPELNCCSVNGPRSLGMLADWTVMRAGPRAIVINSLRSFSATLPLDDLGEVKLSTVGDYPRSGDVAIRVGLAQPAKFALWVRVPAWARSGTLTTPDVADRPIDASRYVTIERTWQPGDTVRLKLELPLRLEAGDRATAGKASVYLGPLLLAFDPAHNAFDADAMPSIGPGDLTRARITICEGPDKPQVEVAVPIADGRVLRLVDYASAGESGTSYRSWLPARDLPPPPPLPDEPDDGAAVAPGALLVAWRPSPLASSTTYRVLISESDDLSKPLIQLDQKGGDHRVVASEDARKLVPGRMYYWGLVGINTHGMTANLGPGRRLRINDALPPVSDAALSSRMPRADGLLVSDKLAGRPEPMVGSLESAQGSRAGETGVVTDGERGKLIYTIDGFPGWDYTVALRVRVAKLPDNRLGQVVSAWTANSDDPLRIVLDRGRLFARIEAEAGGYSTSPGVTLETGRWVHLAAVKRGSTLTLFVDGKAVAGATVPGGFRSSSKALALGGNPRFGGNEHLAAEFADFQFFGRALESAELTALSRAR